MTDKMKSFVKGIPMGLVSLAEMRKVKEPDSGETEEPERPELPDTGVDATTREITDTWEQIKQACEEGVHSTRYQLGDTKTFVHETYGDVVMQIVAFDADAKADGSTAAISWVFKDIITTHVMNSTETNKNGWAASEMRSWLQGEFYATLPTEVTDVIVPVNKTYYNHTTKSTLNCEDTVWLPSHREIFGNSSNSDRFETSGVDYTTFFQYTENNIKYDTSGTAASWWLRSARYNASSSFCSVYERGTSHYDKANKTHGVVLGFCT